MSKSRIAFVTFVVVLISAFPLFAQSSIRGTGTLEQVIKELGRRQKTITSLQADFRQEKEMDLLSKPEVSVGSFTFSKPNHVLWVYRSPKPVTMLISDGWMTTYYPELHKAEKFEVKRFEERIFKYMGAATGTMDELTKYFDFKFVDTKADPYYTLELTPKTKLVERRVRRLKIWIDRKTYLTSKFEYVEGDGDLTRYEFTNVRINEPLPDSRFTLNMPAGTRVEQAKFN